VNDSTNKPRIKVVIDWLKGIKMDIPYSRWIMFSLGVYVLSAAFDKVAAALAVLTPLIR
jgi:hypothetical protein